MNRIEEALKDKKSFIGYITAGHPTIDISEKVIYKMVEAGTDLIEIGIPFSDPNAEGEVIHNANIKALKNGMKIEKAFDLVETVRKKVNVPIVFLTYCNPVFKYGYDEFFKKCKEVGADGIIVPDLPFEERDEMKVFADKYGIIMITLVPPVSKNRIEMLAKDAKGFAYLVSSMGLAGVRKKFPDGVKEFAKFVKENTNIPILIGFGIENEEQIKEMSEISDGIILDSAIVNIIEESGEEAPEKVFKFIKEIKNTIA
ncbi:tryptophan synthase subunit alpha [Miniphocaeibacter halophilus]|uniref:Tryptophan synthase subunit alpha n=1 Tax=Miniphocaeibacter halophilus TaxID=2931922 RepID=A0AC61MR98_9FIRM|nr:tryptophan synthase subunit alpha [Miniphocaeibacter halophilus]QQK08112.1 tryptophan synthase subunit alpha [Miniphocaeibacter halophilus]